MSEERGDELTGPLVIVSHRGPFKHDNQDGQRVLERGGGGLVSALSGAARHLEDAVWVCAAMSDEDEAVSREHDGQAFELEKDDLRLRTRMLAMDPEVHHKFYSVIANPILWFVQHQLWDLGTRPDITRRELDAFENGYVPVNACFADAATEEVEARGGRATVLVQDYHFYLVAQEVRKRCPEVFLHHFVHIPWPQPDSWRVLPPPMREALFAGLLANDVVAFHTKRYARNFLLGCQELCRMRVDFDELTVDVDGRTVAARWYPISADVEGLERMAQSEEVLEHERRLSATRREHLILRVDRADPSKNILRGFRAFDTFLDDHPDLAGRVTFLALLQPTRQDVDEYVDYLERIRRVVADVNLKHGTSDWQPIDLRLEENLEQAVAAYKLFDVLVVNAVFDGMNLVAKEATLVNEHDGVLVLSESAGAHEELGGFAVTVNPFDVQQQADALFTALTMHAEERRERRERCVAVVREKDGLSWLAEQLRDLRHLREHGRT